MYQDKNLGSLILSAGLHDLRSLPFYISFFEQNTPAFCPLNLMNGTYWVDHLYLYHLMLRWVDVFARCSGSRVST